jgi:hypothetical protein
MNKIGQLLDDLHGAETDLAHQYRVVAGRQAAEDVQYLCHTLARQADQHAERVRLIADRFGARLSEPGADRMTNVLSGIRHKASEIIGRRPEQGCYCCATCASCSSWHTRPTSTGSHSAR